MDIATIEQGVTEEQHFGTCSNCRSEALRSARVRSAFWHNDRLVVLEDLPALVCDSCGEQFYDDNTVVALDMLRGENFPSELAVGEVNVPVFSFANLRPLGAME
jgi:YgiT-type zinc finger domain-containing protein